MTRFFGSSRSIALVFVLTAALPSTLVAVGCSADETSGASAADAGADTKATDGTTESVATDGGNALDGAEHPVASVPTGAVCNGYAIATCAFLEKCRPQVLEIEFEDPKTCVGQFESICNASVPPGGFRKDDADALAVCLAGLTCDDVYGSRWIYACELPRAADAKPLGASCRTNGECESRGCSGNSLQCGTCLPLVPGGGSCDGTNACARSGVCSEGTCIVPAFLGEPCDASRICRNGLVCQSGTCAKNGGVVGTPCTTDAQCDVAQYVECNKSTHQCEAVTLVDLGGTCDRFDDAPHACAHGGSCSQPEATPGECVAGKAIGEACTSSRECEGPINCREGKCVLPTYVACP